MCLTLNLDQRDTGIDIFIPDGVSYHNVFVEELRVVLIGIPLGLPVTYDTNPEPNRVNLASH